MREWGGREGGRVAAPSRRVPAASSTGGFAESRLLIAAEFMQRLFIAAPSLCRFHVQPRRGNGSWRRIAEGVESGFSRN